MALYLPSIDTDPNRGVTYGVMPIWVLSREGGGGIEKIHAPSLTYNDVFGWTPTYRYYYFPNPESSLVARGSYSRYEHEGFGSYQDQRFLDRDVDVNFMAQLNADASQRFFGIGPNSPKNGQTNYTARYVTYALSGGTSIVEGSHWRLHAVNRFLSEKVGDGPIPGLPAFTAVYPGQDIGRKAANTLRAVVDYDDRDGQVTPQRGAFLQLYAGHVVGALGSDFDFASYGADARYLYPWRGRDTDRVTAVQAQYHQVLGGGVPFWLLPSLGGKYSLRAYGEGRYVDRGMTAWNVEERFTFYKKRMSGVVAQFQAAPFAGVGAVFDNPGAAQAKYLRPVVGGAVRAVAPPQVVGSVDFGVGQEGVAIFLDINYSF